MTASTPSLVDVIAEAIAAHAPNVIYYSAEEGHVACHGCSGEWPSFHGFHAHQARAVLDALTKAGGVEWGIRYGDGDIDGGYLRKSEAETDIARLRERVRLGYDSADDHEPMALLTRQRFENTGPWTEAS